MNRIKGNNLAEVYYNLYKNNNDKEIVGKLINKQSRGGWDVAWLSFGIIGLSALFITIDAISCGVIKSHLANPLSIVKEHPLLCGVGIGIGFTGIEVSSIATLIRNQHALQSLTDEDKVALNKMLETIIGN